MISAAGGFSNLPSESSRIYPRRGRFFETARTGVKAHLPAFALAGVEESAGMMGERIGSFGARKLSLLGRQFLSPRAGQTLPHRSGFI